jgi:hypothetical protein
MSWLKKILPPKINRMGANKKTVPEGLWSAVSHRFRSKR